MMKWCLLLVIMSVLDNAHQLTSNNKEIRRYSSSQETVNEAALCQSILGQIINKLEHRKDIYNLLQESGTRVQNWTFNKGIADRNHWCKSDSEKTYIVHFTWNSEQNTCVKIEVFNYDVTLNFTKYVCDLNTNYTVVHTGFSAQNFDNKKIKETKIKTKRSLAQKLYYVNIAKEIELTECSTPTLNVYLNQTLVYSNTSGVAGNEVPKDTIEVYVDVNGSCLTNSFTVKTKKRFFISDVATTHNEASKDCESRGMSLLSLKSKEDTDEILKALYNASENAYSFWTSLARSSDDWYWSDGEKMNYTNWAKRHPFNFEGNSNCMYVWKADGEWYNYDCNWVFYFICESRQKNVAEFPLVAKIFVDEQQAYWNGNRQNQSNVVELKIGVHGNSEEDHSTKFLLVKKNSPQEAASEQRLVVPKSVTYTESNCVDIRVEYTKEKGFSCQKDKIYHAHAEEKLSYIDAQIFCQNRSMQLVSIQNKKHHLDIEKLMLKQNYGWEKVFNDQISSYLYLQRYQGKKYYMGTHFEATYQEASQFCNEIHMKLLSIRSEEENKRILKFIRDASKGDEYWTSGTRLVDGHTWLWLPYAEPIDYTNWSEGEPSDIDEKCLQLSIRDGILEWNDNSCDTRLYFICERYDNQTSSN